MLRWLCQIASISIKSTGSLQSIITYAIVPRRDFQQFYVACMRHDVLRLVHAEIYYKDSSYWNARANLCMLPVKILSRSRHALFV